MGGAAAGEVASSVAVAETMRALTHRDGTNSLAADAENAVNAANQAIFQRAQRNQKLNGMGTTLVALVVEDRRAWMVNVGDSRGYLMRTSRAAGSDGASSPQLVQITNDHSLVEEQVRLGQMSRAEAVRSPLRNVITRALGTQSAVAADIFELEVEPGDMFMLCSDGLTRELSDSLIESLLRLDLPLDGLCARLVAAANQAGGHDNITCLLVRADA